MKRKSRVLAFLMSVVTMLSTLSVGLSFPQAVESPVSEAYTGPSLEGAEFTVKFFVDKNDYENIDEVLREHPNLGDADRTWVLKTDADGITALLPEYVDVTQSDELFYVHDYSDPVLPLGMITIQETKPPIGYLLDPEWYDSNGDLLVNSSTMTFGNIVESNASNCPGKSDLWERGVHLHIDNQCVYNAESGSLVLNSAEMADTLIYGGFKVQKYDLETKRPNAQGGSKIGPVHFEIVNRNIYDVTVPEHGKVYKPGDVVLSADTDENGYYESVNNLLPYGDYELREVSAPAGYELNTLPSSFHITKEHEIVDLSIDDPVMRGSLQIRKGDEDRHEYEHENEKNDKVVNMPQGNATLAGAKFRVRYEGPFADAAGQYFGENQIFVDGEFYSPGDVLDYIMTTDKDGYAELPAYYLPLGWYTVYEETAPKGYLNGFTEEYKFHIYHDHQVMYVDWSNGIDDPPIRGGLSFYKTDVDSDTGVPQGDASLAGAVFEVTNESTNSVWVKSGASHYEVEPSEVAWTMTTNANGRASIPADALPYGHYKVTEKSASDGYHVNTSSWYVDIGENGKVYQLGHKQSGDGSAAAVTETPIRGGFKFQKNDIETNDAVAQGDAALGATRFQIINLSDSYVYVNGRRYESGQVCYTGQTDANGAFTSSNNLLPYGHYRFEEIEAPTGYQDEGRLTYEFTVSIEGEVIDITKQVYNYVQRYGMRIVKRDAETKLTSALGGASLEGAVFEVVNKSAKAVIVPDLANGGKTYQPNSVILTLTTDANGVARQADGTDGIPANWLPYGTYLVREIQPPYGYTTNGVLERTFSITQDGAVVNAAGQMFPISGNGTIIDMTAAAQSIQNRVIRGDFSIRKIDSETQEHMANVKFRVTSLTTGESHEFTTNENGGYRSSSRFNLHSQDTNGGKATSGMWFGQYQDAEGRTQMTAVNDKLGALPFDTYFIEELRCDANEGYRLWSDVFTITRDNDERGDDYEVNLNNIENVKYKLTSNAWNTDDALSKVIPATDDVSVTDMVSYENLEVGKSYTLRSLLYNATTGEVLKDANGLPVSVEKVFTPEEENGSVKVTFFFDATGIEGGRVVAYQYLTETDTGYMVAKEDDPTNEDQTVIIPSLQTKAVDTETGLGLSYEHDGVITVKDTVYYSGLNSGQQFTLTGTLVDGDTGEVLKDKDGNAVTAVQSFRCRTEDGNGAVELFFNVDVTGFVGRKIVVYEELTKVGVFYAEHKSLTDVEQTIYIPEITTSALAEVTGTKNVVVTESTGVVDTVSYHHVRPGMTYQLEGTLVDKESGETVATGTGSFTANSESGNATVRFDFDSTKWQGKELVVYEKLFATTDLGKTELIGHEDKDDFEQTVFVPMIKTDVADSEAKEPVSYADNSVTVVDTVSYTALAPNSIYTIKGTLMDKATGERLLDYLHQPITAETTFTTGSDTSGTAEVVFTFNGVDMKNVKGVAFEYLYENDIQLTNHADIEDTEQTFWFPTISTTLIDEAVGDHMTLADKGAHVVDTVTYHNVAPGVTYTVKGQLIDQSNSQVVAYGSATFVAESEDGTVDVDYRFDGTRLADRTVVALEELTVNDAVVADHKDVHDEAQASHLPQIDTSALVGKVFDLVEEEEEVPPPSMTNWITVTSRVEYHDLVPGREYTITSKLRNSETGELVLDAKGNEITASVTFVPSTPDGEVELTYTFEAPVDFTWTEPEKPSGPVYKEVGFATKNIYGGAGAVVTDTISYSNLLPGKEYTVSGVLVDKATGQPITDKDGNQITAEKLFTPVTAMGDIDLDFVLDATLHKGKTLVVFETLSYNGAPVAKHEDLNDADQTVYVPSLKTVAIDGKSKLHMGLSEKDMTIVDTVTYQSLEAGKTYTIKGTLMDKATGEALTDGSGNPITAETSVLAYHSSGSAEVVFHFDGSAFAGKTVVVFEELYERSFLIADHKDIDDPDQTVYIPKISTVLLDGKTGQQLTMAEDKASVVDTVSYENVEAGREYRVNGQLVDRDTGAVVATGTISFTATSASGTVQVNFLFDAVDLAGHTLVAYETLMTGDSTVARHEDKDDTNQMTYLPSIATEAMNNMFSSKNILGENTANIKDIVTYRNLVPGKEYTVTGKLVDRKTGEFIKNSDNTDVTAQTTFTASAANGSVDVNFAVEGSRVSGKTLVVYEYLTVDGKNIAVHDDISDDNQMVYVPRIATELSNSEVAGMKLVEAKGSVTLVDKVTYEALQPGKTYTVTGTLMDKDTGEAAVVNGKPVTATKQFTATDANGEVELNFTFDARAFSGKTLVAYEVVTEGGYTVAVHRDINDESQTVYLPVIGTEVRNGKADMHMALAENKVTVVDTVTYENLVPSIAYRVVGKLVDKSTGNAVATAQLDFTPTASDGTVDVTYVFDGADLANHIFVAYEYLYLNGVRIAVHEDIEDTAQTMYLPKITTHAVNGKQGSTANIYGEDGAVIVDTVSYENVVPGKQYVMTGTLMNKDTGKALTDADGNEIRAIKLFTADAASGTVDMEFSFDGSRHLGETIVVFETMSCDNTVVAMHEDIDDPNQTVYLPQATTAAVDGKTHLKMALAEEDMTIVDTVTYSAVEAGKDYVARGTLVNKLDGSVVATAESAFRAGSTSGTVDVTFAFDGSALAGTTLVAYEELYEQNYLIAEHKDLNDEEQTVYIPKVDTVALNGDNHLAMAADGLIVTDTVTYENVVAGENYVMNGQLVDKVSGEVLDEKQVSFKADSTTGSVTVDFAVDGRELAGHTLVVYETLTQNGYLLAVHQDTQDESQSVHLPDISTDTYTVSKDSKNLPTGDVGSVQTVHDVVHYSNVIPGVQYTVSGTLNDLEGNVIATGETVFTAGSADGDAEVAFDVTVTEDLLGQTLVAYETLMVGDKAIGVHADANDHEQYVYLPKVTTEAVDKDTGLRVSDAKDLTVEDRVSYEALQPNKTYTVKGRVVDKETGNVMSTEVETTFTPDGRNGIVVTDILVNASELAGKTLVAFETIYDGDAAVAGHTDVNDEAQTIHIPQIDTNAFGAKTGAHMVLAKDGELLKDTVSYRNLAADGKTSYELLTVLVDAATGEVVRTKTGEDVTVTQVFKPGEPDGEVTVEVPVDTSELAGRTVVFYEYLYVSGEENVQVASHADASDADQSVHVPLVTTSVIDATTQTRSLFAKGKTVVEDTVYYENLIPGETYTVSGKLMLKSTGEVFTDSDGNPITGETTFVADAANGTAVVTFDVDASYISGDSLVAFETLYWNGYLVGMHEDIDDEAQTARVPYIRTVLHIDGDKVSGVGGDIDVVDDIYYENLIPGVTYRVNGVLMDKATGTERLDKDGMPIRGETIFTADETGSGVVYVHFTVDTNTMSEGATLVAFETLSIVYQTDESGVAAARSLSGIVTYTDGEDNGVYVEGSEEPDGGIIDNENDNVNSDVTESEDTGAEGQEAEDPGISDDKDLDNSDQTVDILKVNLSTFARQLDTDAKQIFAVKDETIVDTVSYENLRVGEEFKLVGTLMNKSTGETITDADGNAITSETVFTPEESAGTVDVTFTIDTLSVADQSVVVFEKLYHGEDEIASHEDIEDAAQTVDILRAVINTQAMDKNTKTQSAELTNQAVFVDTVSYSNLIPGLEYTVSGALMDKETGEALLDANKNPITAKLLFTPDEATGYVELPFTVDTSMLAGKTVVVFEELYYGEDMIALHADLNDAAQSIYVADISTSLMAKGGAKEVPVAEQTTLVDTVSYENLVPGVTYRARGVLMDKTTGEEVNGSTVVVEFTPEKADGEFAVEFNLDTTGYASKELVAYEIVTAGDLPVAEHRDMYDAAQTVMVQAKASPVTGFVNHAGVVAAVLAGIALLMTVVYWLFERRRAVNGR